MLAVAISTNWYFYYTKACFVPFSLPGYTDAPFSIVKTVWYKNYTPLYKSTGTASLPGILLLPKQ